MPNTKHEDLLAENAREQPPGEITKELGSMAFH